VDTRILRTFWLINYGRLDEALAVLDTVIAADPYPPSWYWEARGSVLLHMHRYLEAIEAYSKTITFHLWIRAALAVAYAHLGRIDEAHREIDAIQRAKPGWTISDYIRIEGYENSEIITNVVSGLRKAGLPVSDSKAPCGF
jgi:tetratricopeptide (TPR) repeat protein